MWTARARGLGPAAVPRPLLTSSADLSNAFTHVVVPDCFRRYQAGPKVRVSDLPLDWVSGRWRRKEWVRPVYKRLAMGFSHAVFF